MKSRESKNKLNFRSNTLKMESELTNRSIIYNPSEIGEIFIEN